ncbi:hypothetical protein PRIPAC_81212 [Pristionchus pacificus]|uniref:Uncharacterized protein n=1 Tax=Pristionchus pacificus TaxID=54126 RepID=A0A2A6CL36_PRIPA|nr:hypothetical protein PRIPAC_81212 [Pristionchus pacificus]|eukprot:PDM78829.1 hypothetical protein PRIPAC_31408 [Pristionchus pacificus]
MRTLYALLFSALAFAVRARDQTVGVRGTLMCGSVPLSNAEVFGSESEFGTIKPVVKFYHRCNNKGIFNIPNLCRRKITYEIPKSYINSGKNVGQWYDMGVMNMEAKVSGEDTECI